jgi:hypothetical protein
MRAQVVGSGDGHPTGTAEQAEVGPTPVLVATA